MALNFISCQPMHLQILMLTEIGAMPKYTGRLKTGCIVSLFQCFVSFFFERCFIVFYWVLLKSIAKNEDVPEEVVGRELKSNRKWASAFHC